MSYDIILQYDPQPFLEWLRRFYELFVAGAVVPVALIALGLRSAGNRWSHESPKVNGAGKAVGLLVAVLFMARACLDFGVHDAALVLNLLIRGACVQASVQGSMQFLLLVIWLVLHAVLGVPLCWIRRGMQHLWNSVSRTWNQVRLRPSIPRASVVVIDPVQTQIQREQLEEQRREEAVRRDRANAEHQRREAARLRLQVLYDRHRWELKDRLPERQLLAYFDKFITDSLDPVVYEERVMLLEQMLTDRLQSQGVSNRRRATSMEEILQDFAEQEAKFRVLVSDPDIFETMRAILAETRDEQLRKFLS